MRQGVRTLALSSTYLIGVCLSLNLTLLLTPVQAQTTQSDQAPAPTQGSSNLSVIQSAFNSLLESWRQKERSLGSRGICILSPGYLGPSDQVWHDRPLFLWKDSPSAQTQEIILSTYQTNDVVWEEALESLDQRNYWLYAGPSLEPGEIYRWELGSDSGTSGYGHVFEVMGNPEREKIAKDLKELEVALSGKNASPLEIALEKAKYFSQKRLWSDMLTVLYLVPNPPVEFTQALASLQEEFC
jgi:hypothetical protein